MSLSRRSCIGVRRKAHHNTRTGCGQISQRAARWDGPYEPRTTNHEPRATSHEPRATSHEPRATSHEPRATSHEPRTTNHEPRTTNHEPRTTNHEPRTTNHEPRTTNHEPRKKACRYTTSFFSSRYLLTKSSSTWMWSSCSCFLVTVDGASLMGSIAF